MYQPIQLKTNTPSVKNSTGLLLIPLALALACFALSPAAQAVLPAPDGGYPNGNTAEGTDALFGLTTGLDNTAIGGHALFSDTTGRGNTATGLDALKSNTTGEFNTATGLKALFSNTTGFFNTATGPDALYFNTTGVSNTAIGINALHSNATANNNIGIGYNALFDNTTGSSNTAIGTGALQLNTGKQNAALGYKAGQNLTTGSGNVCIGAYILGVAGESNTTRIKNVYASLASGRAVYVNSDDKIGTLASSRRYKEQIKPMDKGSEAILALKPVTFRYKKEVDPTHCLSFGLIAEEVAKVNADLVTCDADGTPETVRYEAVNAMLLNEFLKAHRKMEQQDVTIARQQKQIEALAAGLQKVSAQLEVSKSAPQTVLNSQ
jgi:hypothetical protein